MTLNNFNILDNKLNISITDVSDIISVTLWNNLTYKDYSKSVDITNLFVIDIDPNDLNPPDLTTLEVIQSLNPSIFSQSELNGIYFIEIETSQSIVESNTSNLDKYKECILELISKDKSCDGKPDQSVVNAHSLLIATQYSIDLGIIEIAIKNLEILGLYCNNGCSTCNEYK